MITPKVTYGGDKVAARMLISHGMELLRRLYWIRDNGSSQDRLVWTWPTGERVQAMMYRDLPHIDLFVPPQPVPAQEEVEIIPTGEELYLVFNMGFHADGVGAVFWDLMEESDHEPCFVWNINKNDWALIRDPTDTTDDPPYLDWPCEWGKVREWAQTNEVHYAQWGQEEWGTTLQGQPYRLWVGYGRGRGQIPEAIPQDLSYTPAYSDLGLCGAGTPVECNIGQHVSGGVSKYDEYPYLYACNPGALDYIEGARYVDYDAYSGTACSGTGIAGQHYWHYGTRFVWAVLPIPSPSTWGTNYTPEQSHTGIIGTEAGAGEEVCLRVDRSSKYNQIEIVDVTGSYSAGACKIYYLNNHNLDNDTWTWRTVHLPIRIPGGVVKLRDDDYIQRYYQNDSYYGVTAKSSVWQGGNLVPMFPGATAYASREIVSYLYDGDNLCAQYCTPRSGFYKNLMYQFYCSWGRYRTDYYAGEKVVYTSPGFLANPVLDRTEYVKTTEVWAACALYGVDDPDGPYASLAEEDPLATNHDPRDQTINTELSDALKLWINQELKVHYIEDDDGGEWDYQPLADPRSAEEGLARKLIHRLVSIAVETDEDEED